MNIPEELIGMIKDHLEFQAILTRPCPYLMVDRGSRVHTIWIELQEHPGVVPMHTGRPLPEWTMAPTYRGFPVMRGPQTNARLELASPFGPVVVFIPEALLKAWEPKE